MLRLSLGQAIRLDPNDAVARTNRGGAYLRKGDYDRAISDFDQAIQLDPKLASAYGGRAVAYARKGDYGNAISDYDQAIRLDPKNSGAYVARGEARPAYKRAFEAQLAVYTGNSPVNL